MNTSVPLSGQKKIVTIAHSAIRLHRTATRLGVNCIHIAISPNLVEGEERGKGQ